MSDWNDDNDYWHYPLLCQYRTGTHLFWPIPVCVIQWDDLRRWFHVYTDFSGFSGFHFY